MEALNQSYVYFPLFLWSVAGLIIAFGLGVMNAVDTVLTERKHNAIQERDTSLDGFEII